MFVEVPPDLARRLVDSQFPALAGGALTRVEPAGSDHVIYRLGAGLAVRFPRHDGAAGQAVKEFHWLPRLAPHLPLAVPVPVGVGEPDLGYPWRWAVARWLDGEVATAEALGSSRETAVALAEFLIALQAVDPGDAPDHAGLADQPLSDRDAATRAAIAATGDVFDGPAMTAVWDAAVNAPGWDRPPVWFHGDFHTGNLLMTRGRLSAVIDFGGLGRGDPARDLTVAYTLMSPGSRATFRAALGLDDATWVRGRGRALTAGLNAYIAYAAADPRVAALTTRQVAQTLLG